MQPPPKKKAKVSGKRKREEFILGDQEPTHQQIKKQNQDPKETLSPQIVVLPKIEEVDGGVENDIGAEYEGEVGTGQLGGEVEKAHNSLGETLECPFCPKVFASSSLLERHATTHQKKRFQCDLCEKVLSRKDNLMAHKRNVHGHVFESGTHEPLPKDEKKFQCDICEKVLTRKDNLMAHKKNVHGHVLESGTHEPKDATVEHHNTLEPDD